MSQSVSLAVIVFMFRYSHWITDILEYVTPQIVGLLFQAVAVVTVTVAVSVPQFQSLAVYVNVSVHRNHELGVYCTSVHMIVAVQFDGVDTALMLSVSQSASVSLANTLIVTDVSCVVDALSSIALGGLFQPHQPPELAALTVMFTTAVAVPQFQSSIE